jgi:hypothetical protein
MHTTAATPCFLWMISWCSQVSAHDMQSLLYAFMDEFLFQFCVEGFVAKTVKIISFDR